ncbi:MAG TPA: G1 family glutamic endopeptidase [Trebonia sp.]|nr:G1 family glutamic endopeptidase [Trebonia sp.]
MKRLLRRTVFSLLAALPALGLFIGVGVTASASVHPAATSNSAQKAAAAKAAAVAFVKSLKVGYHAKNKPAPVRDHSQIKGLTQVTSTNWSGYADTGSGFSSVSATWKEPTPSCSGRSTALAAFWVGIDGYTSASVEQDGTLIECYEGGTYQFSWWEIYPVNSVQVVGESVAAGDSITATVTRSGTSYKLSVTDSTHSANSFSTTQTYAAAADSSAEWIAEAPSGSTGVEPLAKFSTWTDANSAATAGSTSGTISSFPDDEITMITSSGATEAQPSALNSAGNSFTVTWERS